MTDVIQDAFQQTGKLFESSYDGMVRSTTVIIAKAVGSKLMSKPERDFERALAEMGGVSRKAFDKLAIDIAELSKTMAMATLKHQKFARQSRTDRPVYVLPRKYRAHGHKVIC